MSPRLYQTRHGVWKMDTRDGAGKRRRVSLKTTNRELAEQRAAMLTAVRNRKTEAELTLEKLVDWYLKVYKAGAKPNTIECYSACLASLFAFASKQGAYLASDVFTPANMLEFVRYLVDEKYADATINLTMTITKQCVIQAARYKVLPSCPIEEWPKKRRVAKRLRVYTVDEARKLLDYARSKSAKWYSVVAFELGTGLRTCDILALRWEYIDVPHRRMVLPQQIKTGKPLDVFLSDLAMEGLQIAGAKDSGPVFTNVSKEGLASFYKKAKETLGFRCSPHMARHTLGVMLAEAKAPIPVIQAVLGHSSPSTTLVYQHYRPGSEALPLAAVSDKLVSAPSGVPKVCHEDS